MVGISNDDVVEDFDFEKLAGSDEIAGDFDVRLGRSWFAARMIVLCGAPIYVTHTDHIQRQRPSGLALSRLSCFT